MKKIEKLLPNEIETNELKSFSISYKKRLE